MKKLIILLILLNLSLVSAIDMPPVVSLSVDDLGDSLRINAAASDFLDNAGLRWIELYENGVLVNNNDILNGVDNPKSCGDNAFCEYIIIKTYPTGNTVTYSARTQDISDNTISSSDVVINFVPVLTADPVVSYIDQTSVQINWDVNRGSTGVLRYGTVSGVYLNFENSVSSDNLAHSATLTGLNDGEIYYYMIESIDILDPLSVGESNEFSFNIPDVTAPIINNVNEQDMTLTSARITWGTDEASTSRVDYGVAAGVYTSFVEDLSSVVSHSMLLEGLQDGETYYYVVESEDVNGNVAVSAERSFTTGKLIISFVEPDDGDDFEIGDVIEGEIRIENADINDIDVDIEIVLYDDTEDDEIDNVEIDNKDIDAGETEDFAFEFDLSYNLDEGNSYVLYAEVKVGSDKYKQEIDIDIDRKDHDVVIENLRIYSGKTIEVMVDVFNRGRKSEDDVYVELRVYGVGLNKVSERFDLENWDEAGNRESKKFSFEKPEEGIYTIEASVFYGSGSVYKVEDFEVRESLVEDEVKFISGNIGVSGLQSVSGSEKTEPSMLTMRNITFGIADVLLLLVVIYGILWLIKK